MPLLQVEPNPYLDKGTSLLLLPSINTIDSIIRTTIETTPTCNKENAHIILAEIKLDIQDADIDSDHTFLLIDPHRHLYEGDAKFLTIGNLWSKTIYANRVHRGRKEMQDFLVVGFKVDENHLNNLYNSGDNVRIFDYDNNLRFSELTEIKSISVREEGFSYYVNSKDEYIVINQIYKVGETSTYTNARDVKSLVRFWQENGL